MKQRWDGETKRAWSSLLIAAAVTGLFVWWDPAAVWWIDLIVFSFVLVGCAAGARESAALKYLARKNDELDEKRTTD